MNTTAFRRAFALYHAILGLVVFLLSIAALRRGMAPQPHGILNIHLVLLAGVEALAAILFLFPKTVDVGGTVLLLVFAIAILLHGIRGQLSLVVYAAGVILVMVHGSAFSKDLLRFGKDST